MKYPSLQFALREMRATFASKRTWGVLVVVSLILGVSGPFQTYEIFALAPRLIYWTIVAAITFAVGVFFGNWASMALEGKKRPLVWRLLLVGIAAGVPVANVVWLINFATFGRSVFSGSAMLTLGFYSIIIAMGIAVLFILFEGKNVEQKPPQILLRLPHRLRAKLYSLSVQDHYVQICTSKGKHLVLMRFSDAIKETTGIEGMQIHRSHWVALAEIKSVTKSNGKTIVQTHSGKELPVSRTYMSSLEKALQLF